MVPRYVALIADVMASRALAPGRRAKLQADLRAAVRELNQHHRSSLAARFAVTLGDELQCLLRTAGPVWEIANTLRSRFSEVDWVIACGRGAITTVLGHAKPPAPEVDGPAFHHARTALELAKRHRVLFGFAGFGDADRSLNAFAAYYSALYWSWTPRQRTAATLMRLYAPVEHALERVADRMDVHPSAISHLRRRMAWPLVVVGDKMFRTLLETP